MSIQNFLKKENVDTIWDVIIDEDIFKFLTREIQGKIYQVFFDNIKGFFEVEKKNTNKLMDMNKKYILLILTHIRKNYPNQIHNKIKIYDEQPVKESITYEEIQNEKKSQFEKDLQKRQEEFTNAMALPVPEVPEFSDNFKESPISEMDKMIKEMTAKRNYDVEQINKANQSTIENADNWLKPQETSVKSEKFVPNTKSNNLPISLQPVSLSKENNIRPKYLNVEDNTIIQKGKNVTWGKNEEYNIPNLEDNANSDNNIFSKLKKVPSNLENIILTMDHTNDSNKQISVEERLLQIEKRLESYDNKMDKILNLLQGR
jgi:hypothetical protein